MLFHFLTAIVQSAPVVQVAPVVPEVIKTTVVQPVVQTPAVVLQLASIAATAGSAFVVSLFHQLATSKISWLKDNINRVVVALYTVGIALVAAYTQGQLHLDPAGYTTIILSFAIALATALGRYQVFQFFLTLLGSSNKVEATVTQALATDIPVEPAPIAPSANF